MSSALDDIKARAERAAEARRNHHGETDSESIMLAFIAEQSSYDVPPLVAALEAVEAGMAGLDSIFTGDSEDDEAIRAITAGLRFSIAEALEGAA